jgi:hypothetical protein
MSPDMADLEIKEFSRAAWADCIAELDEASLVQSWEYGEAKARIGPWRAERGILRIGGQLQGAWQAQLRPLPCGLRGGLAWINRGPLLAPGLAQDSAARMAMLTALRAHYLGRGFYLRLAPPFAVDAEGSPPDGFRATGTAGWASAVVDLTADRDALRRGLRPNWRNKLNKAERSGLVLRSGSDDVLFAEVLAAYRRFLNLRGFATTVTPELIESLRALLPPDQGLTTFLADDGGALAGWMVIAMTGGRAEYLAGHVEDPGRPLCAGQFLLWQAVMAMKERGLRTFDLGGMDPVLTPKGIYDFKEGLGGTAYRLTDELEAGGTGVLGRLVRWRVANARAAA